MTTPRLRIVTGKGGVGKTTVAAALGLAEARRGRRVLIAEVNGRDRISQLLGVPQRGAELREALPGVWIVDMNAHDAMREYVLLTFKLETIYKAVFENRFVSHFLRLVPSLAELVLLGKVWFHAQERIGERWRFDVIVVDAPATGHALAMLRAPHVVQHTVPPGPLRDVSRTLHEMLIDHAHTALHLVTTPEEMPVNETLELEQAARGVLGMRLAAAVINQRVEALPQGALELLARARGDATLDLVRDTLALREDKRRAGEEHLVRLPHDLLIGAMTLPRLVGGPFDRGAVEVLSHALEPALNGETA